jgi:hypothetical protein
VIVNMHGRTTIKNKIRICLHLNTRILLCEYIDGYSDVSFKPFHCTVDQW